MNFNIGINSVRHVTAVTDASFQPQELSKPNTAREPVADKAQLNE